MKKSNLFITFYIVLILILPRFLSSLIVISSGTIIYNLSSYTLLAIFGIFIWRNDLKQMFKKVANRPFHFIINILIYFLIILVSSIALVLLIKSMTNAENQQAVNKILKSSYISTILVVLVGPFVEELVFRHFLIGKLSNHISVKFLAPISIICFGLIHLKVLSIGGVLSIINYFVIGLVLTISYLKNNKNLAYPLGVHVLNNLLSVILTYL